MNITKEQLRSLIREQMSNVSEVADEYTPMMPPKPVDPEGIAGTDVPAAILSDGAAVARKAIKAIYSPTDRRYISAMMVIDMAEKQGAPKENDKDPKDPDIKHREAAPDSWRAQRNAELPPKWRDGAPGVTTTSLKDLKKMMKESITKEHLQRIIKEELEAALSEPVAEISRRGYEKRYGKNRTHDALGNRFGNKPAPRAEGRDDAIVGDEKRSQEDLGYDDSQYQNYVGGYDDGLKWSENNPHRKRHADKIRAKRSDQKAEETSVNEQ